MGAERRRAGQKTPRRINSATDATNGFSAIFVQKTNSHPSWQTWNNFPMRQIREHTVRANTRGEVGGGGGGGGGI